MSLWGGSARPGDTKALLILGCNWCVQKKAFLQTFLPFYLIYDLKVNALPPNIKIRITLSNVICFSAYHINIKFKITMRS